MTYTRRTLLLVGLGAASMLAAPPTPKAPGEPTFYDFNLPDINGVMTPLSQYKGKVIVIVNVASRSNFTPQYVQLQQLYDKYKDAGLVVLAFPSNDFGNEEPGSEADIKTFVQDTYHVTFPVFSKISVRGDDATPLFHYLTHESNAALKGDPHWNFTKFIVDRKGAVVARFEPDVAPDDPEFLVSVEKALKGGANSPIQRPAQPADAGGRRRDRSRE